MHHEAIWLLGFITLQRIGELILAHVNTRALLARGAIEIGAAHYQVILALHTSWLVGLWALGYDRPVHMSPLVVFIVVQVVRLWVLFTLGRRWTTRIIVVPGETLVAAGPYRFVRHPNYIVVMLEILIVPIALGRPIFGIVFFLLNLAVLRLRIRAENAALAEATQPNLANGGERR